MSGIACHFVRDSRSLRVLQACLGGREELTGTRKTSLEVQTSYLAEGMCVQRTGCNGRNMLAAFHAYQYDLYAPRAPKRRLEVQTSYRGWGIGKQHSVFSTYTLSAVQNLHFQTPLPRPWSMQRLLLQRFDYSRAQYPLHAMLSPKRDLEVQTSYHDLCMRTQATVRSLHFQTSLLRLRSMQRMLVRVSNRKVQGWEWMGRTSTGGTKED